MCISKSRQRSLSDYRYGSQSIGKLSSPFILACHLPKLHSILLPAQPPFTANLATVFPTKRKPRSSQTCIPCRDRRHIIAILCGTPPSLHVHTLVSRFHFPQIIKRFPIPTLCIPKSQATSRGTTAQRHSHVVVGSPPIKGQVEQTNDTYSDPRRIRPQPTNRQRLKTIQSEPRSGTPKLH